jgi:hypothetical protein
MSTPYLNDRGYEIFLLSRKKWRQVYDNKKDMRVLYNGWERWITTMGADIKIGDGSKKTFQTVMGTWCQDISQTSKMGEKQDDEETWGIEGGYSSDRGISRHSIDFYKGELGEDSLDDIEGEQGEEWQNSDGENGRSPPLFGGPTARICKTSSDDVLASPF